VIDLKGYQREMISKSPKRTVIFGLSGLLSKEILFTKKLPNNKKLIFFQDLHTLVSAGLDIRASLELIGKVFKGKKEKGIVVGILENLIHGNTFSASIQRSGYFSPYEYFSIKIGEETGRLPDVLKELSSFFAGKIEQRRKIINAFSYPFIVILTAIGAIVFMMSFVVPMFEDIYQRYNRPLPGITRTIINLSHNFTSILITLFFVTIILIITAHFMRKNRTYQSICASMILKIPVFGTIIKKIYLARVTLFLELLISAKTPLITSIQLLRNVISFYPIRNSLEIIEKDVLLGGTLSESMGKFTVYDDRMVALIKVGEEVNRLDDIFKILKDQYNLDINYRTSMISSVMEPLLIIFIGLIVGVILISMYLPMFQISSSFSY